jgi:hypothetical protein
VLNSYQDKCLDIIKLFDMFSIKHIRQEENSRANRLAQQASSYVVSQGVFSVATVSLVEHKYALRSKGKPILEDLDWLWVRRNRFWVTQSGYHETQIGYQENQNRSRGEQSRNKGT